MLYLIKAQQGSSTLLVAAAKSWSDALTMAHPESLPDAGAPDIERYLLDLSQEQSIAIVLEGTEAARHFCEANSMLKEPWCSYAAGIAAIASEMKMIADPVLWVPKFHDTDYGISFANATRHRAS